MDERVRAAIEEALRLTNDGKYQEALKIYEEILGENLPEVYNNVGNIYRRLGMLAKAVEMYRRAILVDHTFPLAYFNLACALMEMEKYSEAIMFFEKAESLGLRSFELDVQLALCYIATNNVKKAAKRLEDERVRDEVERFIEGEAWRDGI